MSRHLYCVLIVCILGAGQAFPQGFLSLRLGADARSAGMGMASAGLTDCSAAGFNNPAALAAAAGSQGMFTRHRWIQGVSSSFLAFSGRAGRNGFGVHLLYTDIGTLDHRLTASPEPAGTFSAHEFAAGFSWAYRLTENLYAGITIKLLYAKIFVYETTGAAADLGLLWRPFGRGLTAGLTAQNLGRTGRLDQERITLPASVRFGLAMPADLPGGSWLLAADAAWYHESGWVFYTGTEYFLHRVFCLRIGVQSGGGRQDLSAGTGIDFTRFRLDYAYAPLHSGLGDSHKFTVIFRL